MQTVEIKKNDLLDRLRSNMETHRATFEKATEIYQERVIEVLTDLVNRAKAGKAIPRTALYDLPIPEDHTEDYKVAIEMLEFEQRDVLELSQRDFRRYVRDEWEWRQEWTATTQAYVAS